MAFSNVDRTDLIGSTSLEVAVKSTDYCRYFEKHPYTLLQRKECWTCKFSNFGTEKGSLTDSGRCLYHMIMNTMQGEE